MNINDNRIAELRDYSEKITRLKKMFSSISEVIFLNKGSHIGLIVDISIVLGHTGRKILCIEGELQSLSTMNVTVDISENITTYNPEKQSIIIGAADFEKLSNTGMIDVRFENLDIRFLAFTQRYLNYSSFEQNSLPYAIKRDYGAFQQEKNTTEFVSYIRDRLGTVIT